MNPLAAVGKPAVAHQRLTAPSISVERGSELRETACGTSPTARRVRAVAEGAVTASLRLEAAPLLVHHELRTESALRPTASSLPSHCSSRTRSTCGRESVSTLVRRLYNCLVRRGRHQRRQFRIQMRRPLNASLTERAEGPTVRSPEHALRRSQCFADDAKFEPARRSCSELRRQ